MVATPIEIRVDGKAYKLAQLTLGHFAELEQWAKEQPFVEIERKLAAVSDNKLRDGLKNRLIEDAIAASADSARVAAYMDSVAGIQKQFDLAIRVHHPDITEDELNAILSVSGMLQVRAWLDSLTGEITDEAGNG
jgi:hypothetical protein